MRVAWCTPFSLRSAIGRCSEMIVAELVKGHEVEVWTGCRENLLNASGARVRHLEIGAPPPDADICIYQLGNCLPFHHAVWDLSRRHPGIVILHDRVMQHFFASLFLEHQSDPDAYIALVRGCHGEEGAAQAELALGGKRRPIWESDDMVEYSLLPEVVRGALGVIGHSEYVLEGSQFSGSRLVLPLPYRLPDRRSNGSAQPIEGTVALTVGHLNRNKCVDFALRAMADLPQEFKERLTYVLAGPGEPHYVDELKSLASEGGIRAVFAGAVPDDALRSYLERADFGINLRHPNTEGASASLVEQMLAGKAVITSNTGCFREIPDGVTARTAMEADAFRRTVLGFLADPSRTRLIGERAREYANRVHRADRYAAALVGFASEVGLRYPLDRLQQSLRSRVDGVAVPGWPDRIRRTAENLFTSSF